MTKICRIAGLFLLIAAISMIAQGIQPGSTGNVSSVDGWNPAFSMATQTGDNISNLQVVQVTNQTGEQVSPRISGNWIVWIGFENESDGGGLYLYDIANRSEKRILDCSPFWTFPEISDNWIGWVENQNNSVCVYDILNDTTVQVTSLHAMLLWMGRPSEYAIFDYMPTLSMSNNGVVWQDSLNGNMNIFYFNLSSWDEEQITTSPADQISPSTSGNLIVWLEKTKEGYENVFLHNLTSGERRRVTDYPAVREYPRVSGDHIVWAELRDTNYDICCYNISSGNTTWITNDSVNQIWPDISGDFIVWTDNRSGNIEIYVYDLSTQIETQIINDNAFPTPPQISANQIVWSDNCTGNSEIYLCTLENKSKTAPQIYTVQLNSIPQGADVYVNNVPWGRTPSTLSFDRPGSCHIKFVKKGFRPYMATLGISASMTYVVNLEQEVPAGPSAPHYDIAGIPPIDITVDSVPRGANVSIGGAHYGTTLITVADLPASDYPIEVTLEGYQPNSTTMKPSGLANVVNVTLNPEMNGMD
ncbi:periplasmic protein [Methanoculleus bourgensis]|nr:periplasmic protein [Methanoculleus bourgensis]